MRHRPIPGGIYADARPDGAWVCSIGETVLSSWGDLGAPRAMLFNRLSPLGLFKVASKSVWPGTCFVYDGSWADTGIDSPGTQGHGWRPDGTLDILTGGPHQEANGLRYYDPSAVGGNTDIFGTTPGWVTGSPTYGPGSSFAQSKHVSRLHEWTDVGSGVFVGQGDQGGTVIQHPTFGHRLLIDGDSRFVQAHRDGNILAIAVSRLTQGDAHCFWLEEHEIGSLPIYPSVQPQPDPEPTPTPEPIPEPVTMTPDASLVDYFHRRWSELGVKARTDALAGSGHATEHEYREIQTGAFVRITAEWEHAKRQGVSTTPVGFYPYEGTSYPLKMDDGSIRRINENILLLKVGAKVYWKDVIVGCGGPNAALNLSAGDAFEEGDGKFLTPPKHLAGSATPEPPPPPPPDPHQPDPLQKQIDALVKRVAALEAKPSGGIDGKRIALKTAHGTFICVEGDARVVADRTSVGSWETLTIVEQK